MICDEEAFEDFVATENRVPGTTLQAALKGVEAVVAWLTASAMIASLAFQVGCSRPVEPPRERQPESSKPAMTSPISIRTVDPKGLAAAVASFRGKVVLVDYWATWCTSCKELFPHTVALYRELADQGLAVISVSFDDEDAEPAAREFLAAQGATFENFRVQTGARQQSFADFNIEGTIPFLRLTDRAGKVRKEFSAPIKPDEIRRAVKELLAEPAA
jgi:thiol-disulfide isomerase/thioredoxin